MDDNTFECPNCGARIYPEMTRCSQCGQVMYPEDEEPAPGAEGTGEAGWGSILGAVLMGVLIAGGIALVVNFIVAGFTTPSRLGVAGRVALYLAGPLGALAGGYVCAGLLKRRALLWGALVGLLTLPVLALLATHWVDVKLALLIQPWAVGAEALTILAGFMAGWLNKNIIQDPDWREKWKVRGWEDLLYQDLLRKVRFNGSIADRLIEYERKREPGASRLKLIQNAIERWEQDNR